MKVKKICKWEKMELLADSILSEDYKTTKAVEVGNFEVKAFPFFAIFVARPSLQFLFLFNNFFSFVWTQLLGELESFIR